MLLTSSQLLIETKHHCQLETKTLSATRLRKCRQDTSSPGGLEQHHQVKLRRKMILANPLEIIPRVNKKIFWEEIIFHLQHSWHHCKQTLSLGQPTETVSKFNFKGALRNQSNFKGAGFSRNPIKRHQKSSRWKQRKQNALGKSETR